MTLDTKGSENKPATKRFVTFSCPNHNCDEPAYLSQFSYDSWYEKVPEYGDETRCYTCGQQTIREETDYRLF